VTLQELETEYKGCIEEAMQYRGPLVMGMHLQQSPKQWASDLEGLHLRLESMLHQLYTLSRDANPVEATIIDVGTVFLLSRTVWIISQEFELELPDHSAIVALNKVVEMARKEVGI
jgi:hypothetical protein